MISESFACFGTSTVKFPSPSDVTVFSFPSGVLTVTSVFGFVFPLTVVVSFAGSFSALPSVIAGLSSGVVVLSATLTVTFTLSVESSVYVTTTGISTSCPALSAAGLYWISPVSGLIVAPAGAPSPSANFASSGFDAGCPSLSVKFGAVIVVSCPTCAPASL